MRNHIRFRSFLLCARALPHPERQSVRAARSFVRTGTFSTKKKNSTPQTHVRCTRYTQQWQTSWCVFPYFRWGTRRFSQRTAALEYRVRKHSLIRSRTRSRAFSPHTECNAPEGIVGSFARTLPACRATQRCSITFTYY